MKVLVTGASGYLGRRLCDALFAAGHSVVAVVHRHSVVAAETSEKFATVRLDDGMMAGEIVESCRPDVVIHVATAYGRSGEKLREIVEANEILPLELMSACEKSGCRYFVNTDTILSRFLNPYSLTKSHAADWMNMFSDGVTMINVRLDHFYGPGDSPKKFVAHMVELMRRDEPVIELTEGSQTRDFTYVDDVVSAYLVILDHLGEFQRGSVVTFEVGTDVRTSIRDVVEELRKLTGTRSQLRFGAIPYRRREVLEYSINTHSLRRLGWSPQVPIKDGLRRVVKEER